MTKKVLVQLFVLVGAAAVCAAETVTPGGMAAATYFGNTLLASGIGVGIAAGGCGIGMGLVIASALQGIARQPELQSKLQMNMLPRVCAHRSAGAVRAFPGHYFYFREPVCCKSGRRLKIFSIAGAVVFLMLRGVQCLKSIGK